MHSFDRLLLPLTLVSLASLPTTANALGAQGLTLADIRARIGQSGLGRLEGPILVEGEGEYLGTEMTYWALVHPDGRFIRQIEGPISETTGFDGKSCWTVDWGGTPQLLELADRDRRLTVHWLLYGLRFEPDGPLELDFEDQQPNEQELVLAASLRGSDFEAHLTVDLQTGRPLRIRYGSEGGLDVKQTIGEWRPVLGAHLPYLELMEETGGFSDRFEVTSVQMAPATLADPFAPRLSLPADVDFDRSLSPVIPIRRTASGHILIQASVAESEPRWFILDSGAGAMCISPGFADELELERFGKVPAAGVGGLTESAFRRGGSLQVGALTFHNPTYLELDLAFLEPHFGVPVAGICGFGLFSRAVVALDLEHETVELHDPGLFELEEAVWRELTLFTRHPHVRARFEGDQEGLFRIDTGASGTVTFHAGSVERRQLLKGRETTLATSGGVGGTVQIHTGQLDWFELAGHRFEQPIVGFATENRGALAEEATDGNLGTAFLEPFKLYFDYSNRRIAFKTLKP